MDVSKRRDAAFPQRTQPSATPRTNLSCPARTAHLQRQPSVDKLLLLYVLVHVHKTHLHFAASCFLLLSRAAGSTRFVEPKFRRFDSRAPNWVDSPATLTLALTLTLTLRQHGSLTRPERHWNRTLRTVLLRKGTEKANFSDRRGHFILSYTVVHLIPSYRNVSMVSLETFDFHGLNIFNGTAEMNGKFVHEKLISSGRWAEFAV